MKQLVRNGLAVVIREAAIDDSSDIERIVNSVASERIYIVPDESRKDWDKAIEDIRRRKSLLIVALVDGKMVGMAHLARGKFEKDEHVGELGIAIVRGFRRKGIGTLMMKEIMRWATKQNGLHRLQLTVFATNEPAVKLYRNFKFVVEGICKNRYKIEGNFIDDLIMARALN